MPNWLIPIGRTFYAIGLIGIGVQHFIFSDFMAVFVPYWPSWIPGRPFWAYAAGAALIAAGAAILAGIRARAVAAWTGAAILILIAAGHIPERLAAGGDLGSWTNAFKALAMGGGAWVIGGSLEGRATGVRPLERLMPAGRYFLAIMVTVFGIDHFLYAKFVVGLVPSWIPGALFWTYFTGCALIAAGLGMISGIAARTAALMLGIMIFLWFLMLHIPRAIADPSSGNGNEWTSVFEALAFSGIAFLLAALPASHPFSLVRKPAEKRAASGVS